MDSILRAAIVYLALLAIFRVAGKRSLAQITTFDFILLLVIAGAVRPALNEADNSMTHGLLVILTLVLLDLAFAFLKGRSPRLEKLIDGAPLILVANGQPIPERLRQARIDESDILSSARLLQGLERMEQIKYAILERSGGISIIPK